MIDVNCSKPDGYQCILCGAPTGSDEMSQWYCEECKRKKEQPEEGELDD